jgi:hypothetical protein
MTEEERTAALSQHGEETQSGRNIEGTSETYKSDLHRSGAC